jgi:dipeptidyl aminopeptidase/acylaminoacyl peptidase
LAHGQAQPVFIDPENSAQLIRIRVPLIPEVVLKVQDLPTYSAAHPALILENEKFTHLAVAPDGRTLAFCVDAQAHDWTGLMSLAEGRVRQVSLNFDAAAVRPSFSGDGRYLMVEEDRNQSQVGLQVFDLEKGTECRLDGRKARDKFLNFSDPWWSPDGSQVYFKVEYNNGYRKSLGLRPKAVAPRIGEATPECGKVRYYSVAEFMQKFPDQAHYSEMALQKNGGD